jgi:phage terminase large subunit-like protein
VVDVDVGKLAQQAAQSLSFMATRPAKWMPLPHQVAPPGRWYGWLLNAGRGSGKTDAAAHYICEHVNGPPCLPGNSPHWIGIIAPTLGDAVTACYAGPSGIRAHDPTAKLSQSAGGTVIRWANGSEAKLFGAQAPEDVERLRAGGNRCVVWAEELAAWRYLQACWEQMRFGLRAGSRPHWIASTTPKPRPLIKKLVKQTPVNVVVTSASTRDNPHLSTEVQTALQEEYGGTQLGRQELDAELLEEDRDALWKRETLERFRLLAPPTDLMRVTVGVDPSGGAGEQGIVVVGRAPLLDPDLPGGALLKPGERAPQHGFVLADRTCCLSPHGWGRRAVQAALDWEADDIVVERNYGGDMAVATIQDACDALGVDSLPIRTVNASRGKRVRAEPVSALSERGRWHMVGTFPELEDQLCTWTPESDYSPDRLDAMVWPAWHLKLATTRTRGSGRIAFSELVNTPIAGA